jgi:hypothetical protein
MAPSPFYFPSNRLDPVQVQNGYRSHRRISDLSMSEEELSEVIQPTNVIRSSYHYKLKSFLCNHFARVSARWAACPLDF